MSVILNYLDEKGNMSKNTEVDSIILFFENDESNIYRSEDYDYFSTSDGTNYNRTIDYKIIISEKEISILKYRAYNKNPKKLLFKRVFNKNYIKYYEIWYPPVC